MRHLTRSDDPAFGRGAMPNWVGVDTDFLSVSPGWRVRGSQHGFAKGLTMTKRNFDKPAEGRLVQARRLFAVAAILAGARSGFLSVDNVTEKLHDQSGETWCHRTIGRDLNALDTLGVAERSGEEKTTGNRPRFYRWRGHSDTLTRVILQTAERRHGDVASEALDAMLCKLPDPWEMDAGKHRMATHAARLVALTDTEDRECLKCELIYRLGEGWTLQKVDVPVSAFDRFKPIEQLAVAEFSNATQSHPDAITPLRQSLPVANS